MPTAREVAPWVATVERLRDDPRFEAAHRTRARAEALRWGNTRPVDAYEEAFGRLAANHPCV